MTQLALASTTSKIEAAFWAYHLAHPTVYRLLVRFAREWRSRRGPTATIGIKALWERVRWEVTVVRHDDDFKCNNNFHAFYARLIMDREPDLSDAFRLRRQRVQASIGPDRRPV